MCICTSLSNSALGALTMVEGLTPENSANSADQIVINIYWHSTELTAQRLYYFIELEMETQSTILIYPMPLIS